MPCRQRTYHQGNLGGVEVMGRKSRSGPIEHVVALSDTAQCDLLKAFAWSADKL